MSDRITLLKSTVLFSLLPPLPLPLISPLLLLSKFPGADCGEAKIPEFKNNNNNKIQISKEKTQCVNGLCSYPESDNLLEANVQGKKKKVPVLVPYQQD